MIKVYTWFERDRAHVEVRNEDTQETLVEWWDDAVQEAVDDGFLDPRDWKRSTLAYWEEIKGNQ